LKPKNDKIKARKTPMMVAIICPNPSFTDL
jgi:hypothetical protein